MKSLNVMSKKWYPNHEYALGQVYFCLVFASQFYLVCMQNIKHKTRSHICYKWQSLTFDVCDVICN